MPVCVKCKRTRRESEFTPQKGKRNGLSSRCKTCLAAAKAAHRAAEKEKATASESETLEAISPSALNEVEIRAVETGNLSEILRFVSAERVKVLADVSMSVMEAKRKARQNDLEEGHVMDKAEVIRLLDEVCDIYERSMNNEVLYRELAQTRGGYRRIRAKLEEIGNIARDEVNIALTTLEEDPITQSIRSAM